MFIRWFIILFYVINVALLAGYIHLINIFNRMYSDLPQKIKYEYIIVGAGTAGTTVAAGLHSNDILMIEAGGITTNFLDIPIVTPMLQNSAFDWGFETISQTNACLGMKKHRSRWPIGKGFGGSQILNYMLWTKGVPDDYRGWFGSYNDYNYEKEILPYFRQSEYDLQPSELKFKTELSKAFLNASKEYGYSSEFFYPKVNQRNGKRWTMAHNIYHQPRYGQDIVLNAHVMHLSFDRSGNRATGLVYEKNGFIFEAIASKGIILSAGTIGTPTILHASGIGPKAQLINSTVPFRKDLPVGFNLQDHVTTGVDLVLLNNSLGLKPWDIFTFETFYQYLYKGEGPLTMCGCEAVGIVNTNNSTLPNLGFMIVPVGSSSDGGTHFRHILNLKRRTWMEYFDPLIGQTAVSILPIVLHPKSRGKIFSKNGSIQINPNYLSDERDVNTLVTGIRIIEQIIQMPAMQELGAEINPKSFPGCKHLEFRSTNYWKCYVRHLTLSAFHPVGTCRMGPTDDVRSVVSKDFQVIGISNLYIVDASIMPNMPSGNPNAIVTMLAKKFLSIINGNK